MFVNFHAQTDGRISMRFGIEVTPWIGTYIYIYIYFYPNSLKKANVFAVKINDNRLGKAGRNS